jgi:hypothetical protein
MSSIGWVPVDENDQVFQSTVSAAYSKGRGQTRKSVRKIYATEGRAASYSPVSKAKEVFVLHGLSRVKALEDGIMAPLPDFPQPNSEGSYTSTDIYKYGIMCLKYQRIYDLAAIHGIDPPKL